jgi:hypothetical protein
MFVRTQDIQILLSDDPRQESAPVWGQLKQATNSNGRIVFTAQVCRSADSAILARRVDESCRHGIELDGASGRQEIVLIQQELGESPLPKVAAPSLADVDHPGISPMCLAYGPSQIVE